MQASDKTIQFLTSYYELVDAMKVDDFMAYFTPDARMVFASNPAFDGHDAIRACLEGVLGSIDGIRHELSNVWELGPDTVFFECDVTYTRRDGRDVKVPGSAVCEMRDGVMKEQRIYVDVTPVFA
jgi:ketosteroid isomerase-like protein